MFLWKIMNILSSTSNFTTLSPRSFQTQFFLIREFAYLRPFTKTGGHKQPPMHLPSQPLSIINSSNSSVNPATIRPPNPARVAVRCMTACLCRQLWARKLNLVKSEGDRRLESPQGDGQGAHTHIHIHAHAYTLYIYFWLSFPHVSVPLLAKP